MVRAARFPAGLDLATATEIPEAENLEATEGDPLSGAAFCFYRSAVTSTNPISRHILGPRSVEPV